MKRMIGFIIVMSLFLSGCGINPAGGGEVVNVYNWGEYILSLIHI